MNEKQNIFCVVKDKNFVIIDKQCLEDKLLSWKAKGLFCYLLSINDVCLFDLENSFKNFSDETNSAFNELIIHGYIEKIKG
jgi:hypothetical protein